MFKLFFRRFGVSFSVLPNSLILRGKQVSIFSTVFISHFSSQKILIKVHISSQFHRISPIHFEHTLWVKMSSKDGCVRLGQGRSSRCAHDVGVWSTARHSVRKRTGSATSPPATVSLPRVEFHLNSFAPLPSLPHFPLPYFLHLIIKIYMDWEYSLVFYSATVAIEPIYACVCALCERRDVLENVCVCMCAGAVRVRERERGEREVRERGERGRERARERE